ncbi:MAG: nicotinamidase [Thermosulfidibacteraceae bacterium]
MGVKLNPNFDALIVVDMQNDFIEGSLAVPKASSIIPVVNEYIKKFESIGAPIFFTRDWHPENHISFAENGGIWPKHCVMDSWGAMIHKGVYVPSDNWFFINKGYDSNFDAYSGFQGTILNDLLRERGIKRTFICGLATDYCVKNTVIGALNLGYQTFVLLDAIMGVDVNRGDSEVALNYMMEMGAIVLTIEDCISVR